MKTDFREADVPVANDSADLGRPVKALYFGVSGSVKITTIGGSVVTLVGVAGQTVRLGVKRVWATPAPPASLLGLL